MNNDKQNRGFWQSLKGKGYYIALILCAAAIGISGYVYYQSTQSKTPDSLAANVTTPSDTAPKTTKPAGPDGAGDELVPAIGTTPGKQPTESGETTAPTTTESTGTKPAKTMWPVEGETAAAYAMDRLAYNETTRDWRVHNGVDLTATAGTEVKAAADGTVYTVYSDDLLGTTVVIRHSGGYVTTYSSLSEETAVAAGDTVSCGDTIGTVGKTALTEKALEPHVHFSVTCNDKGLDPAAFVG